MFVTDLGSSSVLTLIVLLASTYLACCKCGRGAIALIVAFIISAVGISLAKLLFFGCQAYYDDYGIRSPSGHAALSLAVYGTLAILLASQSKRWVSWFTLAAAFALIVVIALSRVLLGFHSAGEVVIGLLIGAVAVAAACLFLFYNHKKVPSFNIFPLLLAVIVAAFVFHDIRVPAEEFIQRIAEQLRFYLPWCKN